MGEKILSISIAAYNVEGYLNETLKSLVCDSAIMDKMEVLVIDDGSTDQTALIAQRYVESYPNTFRLIQKQNGGHGSTLNCSVSKAQGKYFKMLDGDDWCETKNLQKLVTELENTEADIVLSPYQRVYENNGRADDINRHHLATGNKYEICNLDFDLLEIPHAAEMTVRTNILKKQDFRLTEHCAYTDDEYIFSAVLCADTYMQIPVSVYRYRIGVAGQTVSNEGRKRHWRDAGRVVSAMFGKYVNCEKRNMCSFKKKYLNEIIFQTAAFQYANYFLADNIPDMEKDFKLLNDRIRKSDMVFYEQIRDNNQNYQWLEKLFNSAYKIGQRECIIFGAGVYGRAAVKIFCGKEIPVVAYADNNNKLWGKEIEGVCVCDPYVVVREYPHAMIFITSFKYQAAIYQQLLEMGIESTKIIGNEG